MKTKILVSSILTIALCISIIAGASFALFTSESTVNVAVTAGNVEVIATVKNDQISSTLGNNVPETAYTIVDNTVTLTQIVPGDVLTFDIIIKNISNVSISYRTIIAMVADDGLWNGLEVTVDGTEYDGNTVRAAWAVAAPGSADIIVPVSITLPESAGNEYMSTSCSFSYTVEAIQGNVDTNTLIDEVADLDDLKNGGDIIINEDLDFSANDTTANSGYGATGIQIDNGATFNGNGNTITVSDANGTWDCAVNMKNGTIKNATVSGTFRGIFMGSATGDVYIDNVIIDKVCYTFNSDGGSKDYGVYISNSTLNGWTSYSDVHKEVVFTNCNFGQGTGSYSYAFCRPYNASVFENCVFEEGYEFDTSKTSDIVFINCYYGDTLITDENATALGNGETTFFYNGLNGITIK